MPAVKDKLPRVEAPILKASAALLSRSGIVLKTSPPIAETIEIAIITIMELDFIT